MKLLTVAGLASTAVQTVSWVYTNSEVHNYDSPLVDLQTPVTITVPTLNEADYVVDALASLREQNIISAYPELFELMLVDSFSEDDTVAVATPYVNRVVSAPMGLLSARTMGVAEASGDIIINANADVYYPPNYVNTVLKRYTDGVVAVGGHTVPKGLFGAYAMIYNYLQPRPWLYGSASSFRKDAFNAVGGFDLNVDEMDYRQVVQAEEHDLAQRLAEVGKVVFEPKVIAFSAIRPAGYSWL